MKEVNRMTVYDAALRILEYGDCSEAEMRRKLQKKGIGPDLIDEVLDSLKDSGLIDDARYAENYTRSALERGKGPAWIRNKLMQKGVSSGTIGMAAEALDAGASEKVLCLKKALSLCGLADRCELDENGDVWLTDDDGPVDYFSRKVTEDTDRFEARAMREKEKAKLARRLAGAGFSQGAAMQAVRTIEGL